MHYRENTQDGKRSARITSAPSDQQKTRHFDGSQEKTAEGQTRDRTEEPIRIILVDEQPLFRRGVRSTLERTGEYIIVGETTDMMDAIEKTLADTPDIALIDTDLLSADPFFLAQQMHLLVPHLASIMLAQAENEDYILASINAGASAYLNRRASPKELLATISAVKRGEYPLQEKVFSNPRLSHVVFQSVEKKFTAREETPRGHPDSAQLSQRELEILGSIAHGRTNKAVAESLQISDQTVKNHITSILRKLSVTDRTAAVMYALRHGWITLDEV